MVLLAAAAGKQSGMGGVKESGSKKGQSICRFRQFQTLCHKYDENWPPREGEIL